MPSAHSTTPLAEILKERIRTHGPITFAEFMQECLFHPEHGYYNRTESAEGRLRDYFTSVDVHPIFGRLLARQLAEMWEILGRPPRFDAIECGAGVGKLAAQILDFSRRAQPDFYASLHYNAVEQSAARRAKHESLFGAHLAAGHAASSGEFPGHIPFGCIFSNELLDALPIHRIVQEGGSLSELYVGLRGENFCDEPGPLSTQLLAGYLSEQGTHLQEGQQAEICLAAQDWLRDAGRRLQRGFVVTIDYGHEAKELYNERHMRGTLLAYHRHRASEDFYARPGEQDLTAHVNFTALELAGREAGLARAGLVSQSQFLLALGRQNDFSDLYAEGQSEVEKLKARLKLKSLIYPEGMGETFQVLLQQKGVSSTRLTGLSSF